MSILTVNSDAKHWQKMNINDLLLLYVEQRNKKKTP